MYQPQMTKCDSSDLQGPGGTEQMLWPESGLPAQAKKHAESAKNTLLTWKENMTSDKEKKKILEALVMLYYTLGVAWLLQNHGREAYFNLQEPERNMKEWKELYKGDVHRLQVSQKDLAIALASSIVSVFLCSLKSAPKLQRLVR